MSDTLNYYNENAQEYFENTVNADMDVCRTRFIKNICSGAYILDAGCGSGRDSKYFLEQGFKVKAIDGSEEMCRLAAGYIGQPVECMRFENLSFTNEFDAVWACASLLHVDKGSIDAVLEKIYSALKPSGIIYASFKYGNSDRIQGERYFNDMDEERIHALFKNFEIVELWLSDDVRPGRSDRWVNLIAGKV